MGGDDFITQTLNTVAGDQYAVSYYLKNDAGPGDDFQGFFGGQEFNPILNADTFPYTQFTATGTATSSATALEFAGRQVPSFFQLSDISVTDLGPAVGAAVPEPSSFALLGLALPALGLMVRRRVRKQGAAPGREASMP